MNIPRTPIRQRVAAALLSNTRAPLHILRAGLALAATTLVCSAGAAVIPIDVSGISGVNGGVVGDSLRVTNWPIAGPGTLTIENGRDLNSEGVRYGLDGGGADSLIVQIGITDPTLIAAPRNYAAGTSIGSDSTFTAAGSNIVFRRGLDVSPDFGPGSYLGFSFGPRYEEDKNYGWIGVTWSGQSNTFYILSAAYESDLNTSICAGSTVSGDCPAAVPAPATLPLVGLALGALVFAGYRQRHSQRQQRV